MPKAFKIEQTGDRQSNQIQENVKQATNTLRGSPFGDGNLVTGVSLPNGTPTKVNTGLGRQHQGWIVVRIQNGTLGGCVTETTSDENSVTLYSYGNSTCSIWFF